MQHITYRAGGRAYDLDIVRDGPVLVQATVRVPTGNHLTTLDIDITPLLKAGTAEEILAVADGKVQPPIAPRKPDARYFGARRPGDTFGMG